MKHSNLPDEWSELLNGMADNTLSGEQEQRLAELLRTDIEFRQEYVRFCQLISLLTWQSAAGPTVVQPSAPTASIHGQDKRSCSAWGWRKTVAVAIVAVMVVGGLVWQGRLLPGNNSLGTLADVVGRVGITRGDAAPIWIDAQEHGQAEWRLNSGDGVQTDRLSSAKLILSDQTEIQIDPETDLALTVGAGLIVELTQGHVSASVTPQQPGQSLTFVTGLSEVRVLGTKLEILAAVKRTEVAVASGRVRVTRPRDGSWADVGTSQFLSVAETGDLSVIDLPQPLDEWNEDFEQGLPSGWTGGSVRDDLPENSRGAAGAVSVSHPGSRMLEIGSPTREEGLFAWHADSVLHFTFRVRPPEWFHVYLFARSYCEPPVLFTYCLVKPELWQTAAGEWRTVSIPLSEFHSVTSGRDEATLGRIPVRLVFSGQGGATGVEIDRVWIDRSGANADDGLSSNAPHGNSAVPGRVK